MLIKRLKRCAVPFLLLASILSISSSQKAAAFDMAVGHQNGPAYGLGIAVSSLVKVKLLPTNDIDLNAVLTENDQASVKALLAGDVTFALAAVDNNRPPGSPDVRALATLSRTGNLAVTLLVRRDADNGLVQSILEVILGNVDFLTAVDQQAANLTSDSALLGLAVPLHEGAKHFYMENWASSDDVTSTAVAEVPKIPATIAATAEAVAPESRADRTIEPDDARNFILYFGFDEATLNDATKATLREAAAFAATLGEPAIVVAAYTDAVGDSDYNYLLAERRADAVMGGLDALGVRYGRIDMALFGERSPWSVTLDGVNEASNRRVELFIEEPVGEVELLPVQAGLTDVNTSPEQRRTSPTQDGNETIPTANPAPAGGPKERILPSISSKTLM